MPGLENLSHAERSDIARRHLEGAESWLRRLVHHTLAAAYGESYLSKTDGVRKKTLEDVVSKRRTNGGGREVDSTTFGQIIDIATNSKIFAAHTGAALHLAFPVGAEEARRYLGILLDIRNSISHGTPCSLRDLERSICYSNDLADGLKAYFGKIGMQGEYNVPMIIRYTDSLGNSSRLEGVPTDISSRNVDWRGTDKGVLRPGDHILAEIEVDPSYTSSGYAVTWSINGPQQGAGTVADFVIEPRHVGEQLELRFTVTTDRDWHRYYGMDDSLCLLFKVLPPL